MEFGNLFNNSNFGSLGSLISGFGSAYGAWENAKYNKKLMDLNKKYFQYSLDKQKKNDEAFNQGFRLNLHGDQQ